MLFQEDGDVFGKRSVGVFCQPAKIQLQMLGNVDADWLGTLGVSHG
jgi:hypothetical protein